MKNCEEEKLILISQVKAYSRQCEELKKTMLQLQEKSKRLEEQLYHKERIESELQVEVQNERENKIHLVAAFNQEQQKVTELKRQLKTQTELSKQEYLKVQSANKTLCTKLKQSNDQLQEAKDQITKIMTILPIEYQRILGLPEYGTQLAVVPYEARQSVGCPTIEPHSVFYDEAQSSTVSQRPNYSAIPSNDSLSLDIVNSLNPHQYKEQLSSKYDSPQILPAHVKQSARRVNNHKEQNIQKDQEVLELLEQQRKRESILADQALQELEIAERERINKQGVRKINSISQATPTAPLSSQTETLSHDNKIDQTIMVTPKKRKTSEDIFENPLLENIDRDIQFYADHVREITKRPTTAEVEANEHSSLPYDPNLVCHKCGKRYHIGEIQKFKRHIKETCPNKK